MGKGKSLKDFGKFNKNGENNENNIKSPEEYLDEEDPVLTMDDELQLSTIPISPMILEKELHKGHLVALRAQEEFIYVVEDGERFHLFTHTFGEETAGRRDCKNDEQSLEMIKQMLRVADAAYSCIYCKEMQLYSVMAAMEQGIVNRYPEVEKRVVNAKTGEEKIVGDDGKAEDKPEEKTEG